MRSDCFFHTAGSLKIHRRPERRSYYESEAFIRLLLKEISVDATAVSGLNEIPTLKENHKNSTEGFSQWTTAFLSSVRDLLNTHG